MHEALAFLLFGLEGVELEGVVVGVATAWDYEAGETWG